MRYARSLLSHAPKIFFVDMTASNARGVTYVGITSDLVGRAWDHRECLLKWPLAVANKTQSGREVSVAPCGERDGDVDLQLN